MQNLNQGQQIAATHTLGPMMVLAGPGSGKTTVITYRIKNLIEQGVDPSDILVITFSKAAAINMQDRYKSISHIPGVTFSTFHALFFRILKAHTDLNLDNLLGENETEKLIKRFLTELGAENDSDTISNVMLEMSLVNNDILDIVHYNSMAIQTEDFRRMVAMYKEYKQDHNKIDFDDMLTKCYDILQDNPTILSIWQNKYKYIMIDEFQDISKIQYNIVKLLCKKHKNLYIVGDDDQSIYSFRGARPNFLLNFEKDYTNVKKALLNINYRSTDPIIKLSNAVIKHNQIRYLKDIQGTNKQGKSPVLVKINNSDVEASYIAKKINELSKSGMKLDQICVIYRTNIQNRAIVDAFSVENIPYILKDHTPSIYEHFVAKDILAYMQLAVNPKNNQALTRIINKPKRYVSKGTLSLLSGEPFLLKSLLFSNHLQHWQKRPIEDLHYHLDVIKEAKPTKAIKYIRKIVGYDSYIKEYAAFRKTNPSGMMEVLGEITEATKKFENLQEYLDYVEDLKQNIKDKIDQNNKYGVHLSTMHGVKGLEYKAVFVISCVETLIPHGKSQTDEEIEEERRLFYVAITRAKELLYLSIIENRHEQEVKPTRFLNDLIK